MPVLLDIDGVLHLSGVVIPGAPEAIQRLRDSGEPLRFITNNTVQARSEIVEMLEGLGIPADADEISTTGVAAAQLLAGSRVLPLTMRAIHPDLAEHVDLVESDADVVLVGGADEFGEADETFSWPSLNAAFGELEGGARLVCLHRNRWWQTSNGPLLDSGAVVAGLEYAAGVEAELVGKPSAAYFETALAALGAKAEETTMVGDDVEADLSMAQKLGMRGVLVRTGKFREDTLAKAGPKPDAVIDSIADLPELFA